MALPKKPSSLEESPLLGNHSAMTSTINPNKLDHARFTEINNVSGGDSSSPIKVILFLLIIIFVAVIAAILVRNAAANQPTDSDQNPVSTPVVTNSPTSALTIASNALSDATATNLASNTDYVDSAVVSLGTSQSTQDQTSLTSVEYNKYLSFSRVTFTFDTSDNKLPKTNIAFDSIGDKMTVAFTNLVAANIPAELQKNNSLGGTVTSMEFVSPGSFDLMFSDSVKYRVLAVDNKLILDFKTLTALAAATPTPSVTTTPKASVTPTVADSSKPAAPHYENDFAQSKQYISSSLNTNTIEHNVYYVDDYVERFEYSWGEKNKVGDSYIPNAVAYYDTSAPEGSVYLNVEISNLSKEILSQNAVSSQTAEEIQTKTGVNTSAFNLKKITLISFENGVAKYRFELKKKADFRIYAQKTVDNATQVLTIAIMD